jgi:hypothetical protein
MDNAGTEMQGSMAEGLTAEQKVKQKVSAGQAESSVATSARNRSAKVIAKSETNEVVDLEESGTDAGANAGRFQSSVVGTAGNMVKSRNQFG